MPVLDIHDVREDVHGSAGREPGLNHLQCLLSGQETAVEPDDDTRRVASPWADPGTDKAHVEDKTFTSVMSRYDLLTNHAFCNGERPPLLLVLPCRLKTVHSIGES